MIGRITKVAAVAFAIVLGMADAGQGAESAYSYQVGRGLGDVTGPPFGIQLLGFVRADQISEGIQTRQWARTFVIADAKAKNRIAICIADIAFPTHTLKLDVLDRLRKKLGDIYREDNLILAGTHTHGAAGEYHHHLATSPVGGRFCQPYFDALAEGIAASIEAAHADLQPANIYLAQGDVQGGGANRSLPAYMNNPADEREKYKTNTDVRMTLLKFVGKNGDLGTLNWFAVHPTSMTYYNKLITGDNKGYASYSFEKTKGTKYKGPGEFVAAFAQTNCGDVTPNLNLDNTGPGKTDTESTQIIGERQAEVARELFAKADEELKGPIEIRQTYVDFSKLVVADEFTGNGEQHLCPSAFGYAFAAGSTEDGGGHPLFREGMTEQNPLIDGIIKAAVNPPAVSDEYRKCQKPKAILFATGLYRPPMQEQILSVSLVRIGQLVLVVGPCEYTTMTGRRFREAVAKELGIDPRFVVISGYSNDFSGYVTTFQEYQKQQYEGGHTIFGPWTESGYRQEFVKLARAMKAGQPVTPSVHPTDMRPNAKNTWSEGPDEISPPDAKFGDVVKDASESYKPGDEVVASFWSGNPSNGYKRTDRYFEVQRLVKAPGQWETVARDGDWGATCRWEQMKPAPDPKSADGKPAKKEPFSLAPAPMKNRPDPFQFFVTWKTDEKTPAGTYRIIHFGRHKEGGKVIPIEATSRQFIIAK